MAYLEKHRIYELFHEIATQLVLKRPDDPVVFMKQYLELAKKRLDIPKIILIAPPGFDRMALAKVLQEELGVHPLSLRNLRDAFSQSDVTCRCEESEDLASTMRTILESGILHESGWLLVDLPRTKKEARIFQRIGIIPTHVIQLVVSNEPENWQNIFTDVACNQTSNQINESKDPRTRRYLKNLQGLREAYAHALIEVEVGIRSIDELGKDCAKLAKMRKLCGAPSLLRIALIGSRGSGCTTLAQYLAERFNLVHIDYDYIAEQTRLQQNPLGEMLRLFEEKWGERPKPEIRIKIVEKHISGYECLKRGWVLTGYPKTVEDFQLLDLIATPPNRVIFVEVSGDVCRERLLNRRYNVDTGSKHNLSTRKYVDKDDCRLGVHPKDYRLIVERDLQEYDENVIDMMKYAGESAIKIDANQEERVVREKVEAFLMRAAPSWQSRIPRPPPEIDPMDIEYEPDGEPISKVLSNVCTCEPKYSFI
ncbi:PREDICTED: adenylate kinase 8 [Habropoda laboriosa]|uniref:adenylate kinase 8 n=1 Tax=Habropoda laboriosa TaxID=597456 RepID=UPI00083D50A1|nr:PREDICTED: adenylate kinase 8 [Habropoda laboriosa]